jgi:hypothetical protein
MSKHLFYNIITGNHEIWDDDDINKMKDKLEYLEYKEETNKEYSLKEMELILKIEHLKYLVERYYKAKDKLKELDDNKDSEDYSRLHANVFMIMTRSKFAIFKEIVELDINDFL